MLVPIVAIIQGQPTAFVAMASAILLIILIRRLEGVGEVVRAGVPRIRAAYYRMVFDSSGPPGARVARDEERRPADPHRPDHAS